MKLSIVIPAFNVEMYIIECVESLFNQGLDPLDFEIIIVNDGSSDQTLSKCQLLTTNYPNIHLVSQDNQGQSMARNVGLSLAKGTYVFFMDSDDLMIRSTLGTCLAYATDKNLDFFGFGFTESTNRELALSEFKQSIVPIFSGSGLELIEEHDYYNGPCWFFFKRELASDLKFISGMYCEDALFTPRLILSMKKCEVISDQVYIYYTNDKSTLRERTYEKNKKLFLDMFFVAKDFDNIFNEFELTPKAYNNLRIRQESFVFYGIIRFLRLHESSSMLRDELKKFSFTNYSVFPIKKFIGKTTVERFLLFCINREVLLKCLNFINTKLKIIK